MMLLLLFLQLDLGVFFFLLRIDISFFYLIYLRSIILGFRRLETTTVTLSLRVVFLHLAGLSLLIRLGGLPAHRGLDYPLFLLRLLLLYSLTIIFCGSSSNGSTSRSIQRTELILVPNVRRHRQRLLGSV
jgi:hypothetical protein